MNYADNLKRLAQLAGDMGYEQDPDFNAILPAAIEFAELQILRDLDLLSTRVTDDSGKATQNRRTFILPTDIGTFIVLEILRPIVNGVYGPPLLPMSRESLDNLFPSEIAPSQPSIPQYWAPLDQATVLIGPPPDQDYPMSAFGTMRPAPLNPKDSVGTFISVQLPDLFVAAEMDFLSSGWLKNASPQGADPSSAINWKSRYEGLKTQALIEGMRQRLSSQGWGSRLPSPVATPPQS